MPSATKIFSGPLGPQLEFIKLLPLLRRQDFDKSVTPLLLGRLRASARILGDRAHPVAFFVEERLQLLALLTC